jgi:hypothetical protein
MQIDRIDTSERTVKMMAHFLHRKPEDFALDDNLRQKWKMTDKDLEILEIWIEGPISPSMKGFFQDVAADVRVTDLQDPKTVSTLKTLISLIWKCIPSDNKISS